ncbi:MAG TPA: DUF192 domain-containing protein, partial [Candidatus Elarobacter sp.]|nr:DUF192 domain-containing protein [Candidatus Elarobacter sp.]
MRNALVACVILACSAQTPAPLPWCTSVPLPQADLAAVSLDGTSIHQPRPAECRALEVHAGTHTLRLAVASTPSQRQRGLMNLPFVPAGQGMLFAYPGSRDDKRDFWMKDTITPLDMIFIKDDGTISQIAANVPATAPGMLDEQVARREGIARYVIELGAGDAA